MMSHLDKFWKQIVILGCVLVSIPSLVSQPCVELNCYEYMSDTTEEAACGCCESTSLDYGDNCYYMESTDLSLVECSPNWYTTYADGEEMVTHTNFEGWCQGSTPGDYYCRDGVEYQSYSGLFTIYNADRCDQGY